MLIDLREEEWSELCLKGVGAVKGNDRLSKEREENMGRKQKEKRHDQDLQLGFLCFHRIKLRRGMGRVMEKKKKNQLENSCISGMTTNYQLAYG